MGALFLPTLTAPGAAGASSQPSAAAPPQQDAAAAGVHGACLLQLLLREDDVDASELLFGGRHAAGGAQAQAPAPELAEWRRTSKKLQVRWVGAGVGGGSCRPRACGQPTGARGG